MWVVHTRHGALLVFVMRVKSLVGWWQGNQAV
jgi:hypothetical protein